MCTLTARHPGKEAREEEDTCAHSIEWETGHASGCRMRPPVLFWRPWIHSSCRQESPKGLPYAPGLCEIHQAGQRPAEYNHPVRLFWPKSKPLDDMYVEAADLLRSFPVQATISFYNDSESDTDDENTEEEHDSGFESE
ncbi:protein ripply2.2-like [Pseudophryne corroboree]|uniref:protein ripply2.2-like n=1 Tax=Pseudophryne corroboree TaxID=495146 RepID=UPI00308165A6